MGSRSASSVRLSKATETTDGSYCRRLPNSCARRSTPETKSLDARSGRTSLIQFKCRAIIALERGVLFRFLQHTIANDQNVQLVAHEAAKGIFRRADDRLAAHVEAGIDQHRATRELFELRQQPMEHRIGAGIDGLYSRGIVDVSNGRDLRTGHVEFFNAKQLLFFHSHRAPSVLSDIGDDQHIGTVAIKLEPIRGVLTQHRRREGPKALAVFDLKIEILLH